MRNQGTTGRVKLDCKKKKSKPPGIRMQWRADGAGRVNLTSFEKKRKKKTHYTTV